MKPTLHLLVSLMLALPLCAQIQLNTNQEMNWTRNWTNFDPNSEPYPEPDKQIPNIIDKDLLLNSDSVYLMSGDVYVTNGAILIIEAGTVIRCQSDLPTRLIVTKSAKLIAEGNKGYPIVFTSDKAPKSRRAGDWGGIVIMGNATVNSPSKVGFVAGDLEPQYTVYGGDHSEEETTRLAFVRIEFAGKPYSNRNTSSGLSLFAAGNKSVVKNVMVSRSKGDAFYCSGGGFPMENLVSFKAKDDDFDLSFGFQGEMTNVMAVRHPFITDTNGSYAVEIDGFNTKQGLVSEEFLSSVKISNGVFINLSDASNYVHTAAAISAKNLAKVELNDSKISGFANVVKFDKSFKSYFHVEQAFAIKTSLCNVHSRNIIVNYEGAKENKINTLFKNNRFTPSFANVNDLFVKPLDAKNPKFTLKEEKGSYAMMQ